VVNYQDNIGQELQNLLLLKFFIAPFKNKFAEITFTKEVFDYTLMAGIINKIVNNFDDKWMRVLFHELDFLEQRLLLFLILHL
jgi:hypothetical protein